MIYINMNNTNHREQQKLKHIEIIPIRSKCQQKSLKKVFDVEKLSGIASPIVRKDKQWKTEERVKYLAFVYYFQDPIQKIQGKQMEGFYRVLSAFLKTRNQNQCRIYHKAMLKKFHQNKFLLQIIKKEIPQFPRIVRMYEPQITALFQSGQGQKTLKSKIKLSSGISQDVNGSIHQSTPLANNLLDNNLALDFSLISDKINENDKIQNMKTDVVIKNEEKIDEISHAQNHRVQSQWSFHQLEYQQNSVVQPYFNPFWPLYYNPSPYPSTIFGSNQEQQREWKECHDLYLAWTSKLNKLLGK